MVHVQPNYLKDNSPVLFNEVGKLSFRCHTSNFETY